MIDVYKVDGNKVLGLDLIQFKTMMIKNSSNQTNIAFITDQFWSNI